MYICACIRAFVCMYGMCTCACAHVHVCIFVNICIYVCVCMVCVCAVYPPHIFLKRSFFYSENFYCQEIALSSALLPPTPPQLKIYWTVLEAKDIFSPAGPSGKWLLQRRAGELCRTLNASSGTCPYLPKGYSLAGSDHFTSFESSSPSRLALT